MHYINYLICIYLSFITEIKFSPYTLFLFLKSWNCCKIPPKSFLAFNYLLQLCIYPFQERFLQKVTGMISITFHPNYKDSLVNLTTYFITCLCKINIISIIISLSKNYNSWLLRYTIQRKAEHRNTNFHLIIIWYIALVC